MKFERNIQILAGVVYVYFALYPNMHPYSLSPSMGKIAECDEQPILEKDMSWTLLNIITYKK